MRYAVKVLRERLHALHFAVSPNTEFPESCRICRDAAEAMMEGKLDTKWPEVNDDHNDTMTERR